MIGVRCLSNIGLKTNHTLGPFFQKDDNFMKFGTVLEKYLKFQMPSKKRGVPALIFCLQSVKEKVICDFSFGKQQPNI